MQQNMLLVLLLMGLLASVATAAVAGPLSAGLSHQIPLASQPQALDDEHEGHGDHDDHDHGLAGHHHHEEEEHEEEEHALGHVEVHGVVNKTSIAGLGLGNRTQIEAKLAEGKRAHIEVRGGGEASLNVTSVSVDAVAGKVTITAKVLHSEIEGISAGDDITIVITLTQVNITDASTGKSAQVLVAQLELKLP
jgi:hypothetical protein